MEYNKCCLECGMHYFDEDECPNCYAIAEAQKFQDEWDRQLRLLELCTGIRSNEDFFRLWNADNTETENEFKNTCRNLAPEIYESYISEEIQEQYEHELIVESNEQLELFEDNLPF